jgi:amidohydrolase
VDVTDSPNVLTIGSLQVGTRFNVIPDEARLAGTLRTFTPERRADVKARVERTVKDLADSYGATARITWSGGNPPVINDAGLVEELGPALAAAAGPAGADLQAKWVTTAEDFAHYRDVAPILFAHVGATPDFTDYASAPVNHSPQFTVDEAVLPVGVRMHVLVALTYLQDHVGAAAPKAR